MNDNELIINSQMTLAALKEFVRDWGYDAVEFSPGNLYDLKEAVENAIQSAIEDWLYDQENAG